MAPDETLFEYDFTFTNLQEFFFPKGYKDFITFSKEPRHSIETSFGTIEVGNFAQFAFLGDDIRSQIYSPDSDAIEDLQKAFQGVKNRHNDPLFMLKRDIEYRIHFKFSEPQTVHKAFEHMMDLASLFSLLLFRPVYPDSVKAKKFDADDKPFSIDLYPTMMLDQRTLNICADDDSHWNLSISASTVDLDSIIQSWFDTSERYPSVISSIQNETGFRSQHIAHGEIVLFATQFESISHTDGEKKDKYGHTLRTYASRSLQDALCKVFGVNAVDESIEAIGDLRNEIAHVGRPKTWLTALSLGELAQVSRILQLTVVGYILGRLDVPSDVVDRYQSRNCPPV